MLFGSIEVLSTTAVLAYGDAKLQCKTGVLTATMGDGVDYNKVGEDFWLQKCLTKIGVSSQMDQELIEDGYCSLAPLPACTSGRPAYHPLKRWDGWLKCWKETGVGKSHASKFDDSN